jgi:hypothetical protein
LVLNLSWRGISRPPFPSTIPSTCLEYRGKKGQVKGKVKSFFAEILREFMICR